jgi:hypothetical protein
MIGIKPLRIVIIIVFKVRERKTKTIKIKRTVIPRHKLVFNDVMAALISALVLKRSMLANERICITSDSSSKENPDGPGTGFGKLFFWISCKEESLPFLFSIELS